MEEIKVYDKDRQQITMLVQWDLDIYIYIRDDRITTNHNVHFFNSESDVAYVVPSTYESGVLCCKIPNRLLFVALPITGYIYETEDNDSYRNTFVFTIVVRSRTIPSDFIYIPDALDDYISVVKALAWCQDYAETACACAAEAEDWTNMSKSWAVGDTGVRGGEDTDNSKYYSQQSSSSATLAESWAVGGTGTRSGENTNNSKYYAQQASTSASNAKTSETNAAASATSAAESAEKAAQFDGSLYALKEYYANDSTNVGRKSGTSAGSHSFTLGYNCEASSDYSFAEGYNTVASSDTSSSDDSGSGGDTGDENPSGGNAGGDINPGGTEGSAKDENCDVLFVAEKSSYSVGDYVNLTLEVIFTNDCDYFYFQSNFAINILKCTLDGNTFTNYQTYSNELECIHSFSKGDVFQIRFQVTAGSSETQVFQLGFVGGSGFLTYVNATITVTNTLSIQPLASDSNVGCSHSEGNSTTASGASSHSEGRSTVAYGRCSHAEGYETMADGNYSHAEGSWLSADGNYSHAEGYGSYALGLASHSEGRSTGAYKDYSHAEGYLSQAWGAYAHVEGRSTYAYGHDSHAEGYSTTADGIYSHAEGDQTTSGEYAHAEGYKTLASGSESHAEGHVANAEGGVSHAEGGYTIALGNYSHAEGYECEANGYESHAEGRSSIANGDESHAGGYSSIADSNYSHAHGYMTQSGCVSETVVGQLNVISDESNYNGIANQVGTAFTVGNGVLNSSYPDGSRSNAFRVTKMGHAYVQGTFNTGGADYAEFIREWADGNQDEEDRVGYFVTIKNGLLYKADEGDYIIGITSGNPSVVGNADEDYYWKYERDDFGRIIYEDVEEATLEAIEPKQTSQESETTDNNIKYKRGIPRDANPEDADPGGTDPEALSSNTGDVIKNGVMTLSEDYDPSLQSTYVERKDRPEWDYVGMIGVIPVRDDGTCQVDAYCKCGGDGIATYAEERGFDTYRVIERVSENVVAVIMR